MISKFPMIKLSKKLKKNSLFNKSLLWKIALLLVVSFVGLMILTPIPTFHEAHFSTILLSEDGTLLGAKIADDGQWRFPVGETVPVKFTQSIVNFEDEYFYLHPGINPVSLAKAFLLNLKSGKIRRGGSTLSMQLVRMSRNNKPRTVTEKLLEMTIALKLEVLYTKNEILSLYVAHAPFGGNVVGLSAASWRYFGKSPEQLSWSESATLAVLPNSPSLIFPGKNSEVLLNKRNFLLAKLHKKGIIEESVFSLALLEPLPGAPRKMPGLDGRLLSRSIQEGHKGKIVKSTLDSRLQEKVFEKVYRHHMLMKDNYIYNAAAIVVEVKTGKTLAYIGNVHSEGDHGQYVDIITANRSTGSLLKPFLYAAAIDEGIILPQQLLIDIPMFFQGFAPQNFDKKFRGAVHADRALASSLNVPFVNLLKDYGYEKFHHKLKRIGFESLSKPSSHYGLSLILGGAESSLWEITAAYAGMSRVLLNYFKRPAGKNYSSTDFHPNYYMDVVPVQDETTSDRSIYNASSVSFMLKAMEELNRPEEESGWNNFSSAKKIAWKTGTSFGFKDAWAIGITPEYVIGVWIGNADGDGRPELTGVKAAAPLMFSILELMSNNNHFPEPSGNNILVKVCSLSGFKASENCKEVHEISVAPVADKTLSCPHHKIIHLDEKEQFQVNGSCYPVNKIQRKSWFVLPASEGNYYKQYHVQYIEPPPYLNSCGEIQHNKYIELIYPRQYSRIYIPTELGDKPGAAVFEVAHRNTGSTLYWHLNKEYIGKTNKVHQMEIHPPKGHHTLQLVDEQGRELEINFEVISDKKERNKI